MSNIEFSYDVKDNASGSIDMISNKLSGLKHNYGEVRKEIRHLKEGLSVLNGLGLGMASGALGGLGLSKKKDEVANAVTKNTQAAGGEVFGQIGRYGSFIAGGLVSSELTNRLFSTSLAGTLGSNASQTISSSIQGGLNSRITQQVGSQLTGLAMQETLGRLSPNDLVGLTQDKLESLTKKRLGKELKDKTEQSAAVVAQMAAIRASGAALSGRIAGARIAGVGASALSGLGMRLGLGLVTGGIGLAAAIGSQLAYEYAVQPLVDQIFKDSHIDTAYLNKMSNYELYNKDKAFISEQAKKEAQLSPFLQRLVGPLGEYLLEGGKEAEFAENYQMDIAKEKASRYNQIAKALYIQNRE
jgi:hypothetical protein